MHQLAGQVLLEDGGSVEAIQDGDADSVFENTASSPNTPMKSFSTLMIKNPQSRRRFQHILDKIRFGLVG